MATRTTKRRINPPPHRPSSPGEDVLGLYPPDGGPEVFYDDRAQGMRSAVEKSIVYGGRPSSIRNYHSDHHGGWVSGSLFAVKADRIDATKYRYPMAKNPKRASDRLRDQVRPSVFGVELDRDTLTPVRGYIDTRKSGDYGADPLGEIEWGGSRLRGHSQSTGPYPVSEGKDAAGNKWRIESKGPGLTEMHLNGEIIARGLQDTGEAKSIVSGFLWRMVPSGDIVGAIERERRIKNPSLAHHPNPKSESIMSNPKSKKKASRNLSNPRRNSNMEKDEGSKIKSASCPEAFLWDAPAGPGKVAGYSRLDQHFEADAGYYRDGTVKADEGDPSVEALKQELRRVGYTLRVVDRKPAKKMNLGPDETRVTFRYPVERSENPARDEDYYRMHLILPHDEEFGDGSDRSIAEQILDWHGGQGSKVYSLGSIGMSEFVSAAMIDAAIEELESDLARNKTYEKSRQWNRKEIKELKELIAVLDMVSSSPREFAAEEAGFDEDETVYGYSTWLMDGHEDDDELNSNPREGYSDNPRRSYMTKREFEEMFRSEVFPETVRVYEQDGIPDKPARREAWNNTVDAYIRDGQLPESAGDWSHPRWLESRSRNPIHERMTSNATSSASGTSSIQKIKNRLLR